MEETLSQLSLLEQERKRASSATLGVSVCVKCQ